MLSSLGSRKFYFSNSRIKLDENKEVEKNTLKRLLDKKMMYSNSQPEFRVNLDNRFSLLDECVSFYPDVECTLHKIARKK